MVARTAALRGVAALLLLTCTEAARAGILFWRHPGPANVVLLSDLHFDPYRDPAKVSALEGAAPKEWARILSAPASATQAAAYDALQATCHARGVDSSWSVVESTLHAAHAQTPRPMFVTVSGDLLTHNFDCRLRTLTPTASDEDVARFAEKTVAFVVLQLRKAFPGVPVYVALGNNDSGCADYHETSGSDFLRSADKSVASGFDASLEQKTVLKAFSDRGDFSVVLPHRMRHTRLIVLDDVFESEQFKDCGGGPDPDETNQQLLWLQAQLDSARKDHQTVWVMAHIPPGVNAYASFHKYISSPDQMCAMKTPTMMLGSDALAETLAESSDIVRLVIFGHTHMDEIKLLKDGAGHVVPAKLVPSVSPVNGNHPAFTVAQLNPQTATVTDYTVYVASSKDGGSFKPEYRYSAAYGEPDFSVDSVEKLANSLAADKNGDATASMTYQRWFLPGDGGEYASGLHKIWPGYACAIVEDGGPAFQGCMCPATPAARNGAGATR